MHFLRLVATKGKGGKGYFKFSWGYWLLPSEEEKLSSSILDSTRIYNPSWKFSIDYLTAYSTENLWHGTNGDQL
jgi:hypothetical protein